MFNYLKQRAIQLNSRREAIVEKHDMELESCQEFKAA